MTDAGDEGDEAEPLSRRHHGRSQHWTSPDVFRTIHRVRCLILASIDDPYTQEQLTAPRMNILTVRPLVNRLYNPDDISVVYCLLANRVQFLREQSTVVHQSVNVARAALCELVATRILRRFHEDNPGVDGLLLLANILVEGFDPFQGAPEEVERAGRQPQWPVQYRGGHERKLMALELAIISESKVFISCSACQRVVNAVYRGRVVYTPLSFVDILPDHYEHHPVSLYDPREAPVLNHHRLIVPRSRNAIELFHFLILVGLYLAMMLRRDSNRGARWEAAFAVYTAGWLLGEFAAIIEHGWEVHSQNLWSLLDVTFACIFGAYLAARVYDHSVDTSSSGGGAAGGESMRGHASNILCIAAPVLLTRLAFNLMPDNIVFISLHALMKDFMLLTFLALWCFTGFLLALQWLASGDFGNDPPPAWSTVCKWLLWIWFGLDGTGIEASVQFHVVLGPALMIAFAFLGNTLFLTVLVAMLTNTFSKIIANETAEIQFRKAVLTFEGVKSDAIFAYPPPFNILALVVLLPLKFVVTPRAFHAIHVTLVRIVNAPTLLLIALLERRSAAFRSGQGAIATRGLRKSLLSWQFTGFSPHGDIQAVFKADSPPGVREELRGLRGGMGDRGFFDDDDDGNDDDADDVASSWTSRGA